MTLWRFPNYVNKVQGVPKTCHDFNRVPFKQLLTERTVLWTYCSQYLSVLFDRNSSQALQCFFSPEEYVEIVLFWYKNLFHLIKLQVKHCSGCLTKGESQNCLILILSNKLQPHHNLVGSVASVAWNLVIFYGSSSFRGMWAFSRPRAQFPTPIRLATTDQYRSQAPEDCRWRTGIHHFPAR